MSNPAVDDVNPPADDDDDDDAAAQRGTGQRGKARGTVVPPGGTPGAGGTPDDGGEPPDDSRDDWPEDARKLIAKLRREGRTDKQARRDVENRLQELEDAKLTDADRQGKRLKQLETENATLRKQLTNQSVKSAIAEAGRDASAIKPSNLWRQVDLDEVDFDEQTGEVQNAAELVAQLRRSDPHLFQPKNQGSADGGNRGKPAKTIDMNAMLRGATGRG